MQSDPRVPGAEKIALAAVHYRRFMEALELPLNDETETTPYRVAKMFHMEFCSHNGEPPEVKLFKRKAYDQYIVVRDIQFSSLCEHHHLPFTGVVHVGYHPREWLAGLSKIPRVVRYFASRPQLQEHLVVEVAEYLYSRLSPFAVMVIADGTHSCMSCRGIRDPKSRTITSKIIEADDAGFDKQEMLMLMGVR